jgi:hypothetical protein
MRTQNPLLKRVAGIERQATTLSGSDLTAWWRRLLADPEANEDTINAGFYMTAAGVLDPPSAAIAARLEARHELEPEQWPDSRLAFYVAYTEMNNEAFTDPEGKSSLCRAAVAYSQTFASAPLPQDSHERILRRDQLEHRLVVPCLTAACPELEGYSHATFRDWLESARRLEPDEYLPNLREFAQTLTQRRNHE